EETRHAMVRNCEVVSASLVAEGASEPALADAAQDSVAMPGVRRSRSGSTIRFILDAARWCRSRSGGGSQARITWSWFSQTALSVLRQRSLEALKQKARRGELFMTVAIGYVRIGNNRIEKDPDRRIMEAIALAFAQFAEMQAGRQVHLWLRHERIPLPAVTYSAEGRLIEWKLPVY